MGVIHLETLPVFDSPVFDSSKTGERVTAERQDQPGAELNLKGFGSRDTDCGGDWSWKPYRDKALGIRFRTFKGVPPSMAELSHT